MLSKSSSADLFPRTGENPSQVFSRTGNNQPLRRGLLKSEDTPCPNSGHVPKQDTPSPESGQGIPQIVEPESELPLVPNQDTCPESGLAGPTTCRAKGEQHSGPTWSRIGGSVSSRESTSASALTWAENLACVAPALLLRSVVRRQLKTEPSACRNWENSHTPDMGQSDTFLCCVSANFRARVVRAGVASAKIGEKFR